MSKILREPTLDALFDSGIRVRLLKFFVYSPDQNFETRIVSQKLRINPKVLKKQLEELVGIGFIKAKGTAKKQNFSLNKSFSFYEPLKTLVVTMSPVAKDKMVERIMKLGKIKLVIISGVFTNSDDSRADLMMVGDKISQPKLRKFLSDLEAEVGKELNYAVMETKEFNYRFGMYDRFVRDMLEFKHEKLINKLKI